VIRTRDKKLWWVHSEAIYASLLAHNLTGDDALWSLFRKTLDYSLRTFPNPDRVVGEWIQSRDRQGAPVDQVVALPVKDPYDILRNLLMALEFLPAGGA
jgi:N-acylglucosamine 2-epimerase